VEATHNISTVIHINHPGIFSRDEKNFFVYRISAGHEKIFGEVFKVFENVTCFTSFKSFLVLVKGIVAWKRKYFTPEKSFSFGLFTTGPKFSQKDSAQKFCSLFFLDEKFLFPLFEILDKEKKQRTNCS